MEHHDGDRIVPNECSKHGIWTDMWIGIRTALAGLHVAWQKVVAAFYMIWWGMKFPIVETVRFLSDSALAAASLFLVLELVHVTFKIELLTRSFPLWVLWIAGAIAFQHHWRNLLIKRAESHFVQSVTPIYDRLNSFIISTAGQKGTSFDMLVGELLRVTNDTFQKKRYIRKRKGSTSTSIMVADVDGTLEIIYRYPPGQQYDPTFSIRAGQGAAGTSFKKANDDKVRTLIYVPVTKHRFGIKMEFEVSGKVSRTGILHGIYEPIANPKYQNFSSMLCVPITNFQGECWGVLNVDSPKRDRFDKQDAIVANSIARILGIAISLNP